MQFPNKYGFTLVELVLSMLILSVIIVGLSLSLVKIGDNFTDNTLKTNIFSEIKDFNFDSYLFKYSSGKVLTGGLLLYGDTSGILVGSFQDKNAGYDYTVTSNSGVYDMNYLGYFYVPQNSLSGILNNTIDITTLKFNDGKIFSKLHLKDFQIVSYNTGNIFEVKVDIFKIYLPDYTGENKTNIVLKSNEYLQFNFNF